MSTSEVTPGQLAPPNTIAIENISMDFTETMPKKNREAEEDSKLKDLVQAIKTYLRLSTPAQNCLSLPVGQLTLADVELRSFLNPFEGELSFRGDYAACIRELFVVQVRMAVEFAALRGRGETTYLWQSHAESLNYLLQKANQALQSSVRVMGQAARRGLIERTHELECCRTKLEETVREVTDVLQQHPKIASKGEEDFAYSADSIQEETQSLSSLLAQ
ncbi:MAG: hypothetical protein M3P27_01160 [Acidobacteriota bacterium]|nr:hypothetical protein [Acidobacteriota bacterium]